MTSPLPLGLPRRHLSMLGLMGSGKSTVGERLARRLSMPFVDIDTLVVAEHGPISEIFERVGEAGFRLLECEALAAALAHQGAVIAPGGGALTHAPSRELLASTLRIHLEVPHPVLVRRLSGTANLRPLVGANPTLERVEELWRERRHLYAEAEIRIDADAHVDTIVESIIIEIERFSLRFA